jgi:PKD repeat protein
MSKKILFVMTVALLAIAWMSLPPVVTRGPYIQSTDNDGGLVVCRTDTATSAQLHIGGQTISSPSGTQHVFSVSGLTSGTAYPYTIEPGLGSGVLRTHPGLGDGRPFRFLAFGDSGTGNSTQYAVADRMELVSDVHFALGLGDLVYESGAAADFDPKLFTPYKDMLPRMTFWPTLGNHDASTSNGAPFYDAFYLPTTTGGPGHPSNTERYYSFDYGMVHFVCLDSESSSSSPSGAMWQWAEDDLIAAQDSRWRIVFMHHPVYSHGTHDSDAESELRTLRQNLVPLFDAQLVDLVLVGHSHNYERSYLVRASAIVQTNPSDYTNPPEGAVYVVSGCAGKTGSGDLDHPLMAIGIGNVAGFSYVDVTPNEIRGFFVDQDGTTRDGFSITKNDTTAPPVACFTAERTNYTHIAFDARCSIGDVSGWIWDFGDGTGGLGEQTGHLYPAPGRYTVSLLVVGADGSDTETHAVEVPVEPIPQAGSPISPGRGIRPPTSPPPTSTGIWIDPDELALLPTTGAAWNELLSDANVLGPINLSDQDEQDDSNLLAAALVAARTGDAARAAFVRSTILNAMETENGGRTLALGRNLLCLVLAADLIGLSDVSFRSWLAAVRTEILDGRTLISTHEDRPNNWGTHAGASRIAAAVYLGDNIDLARAAEVFRGYLGDRSVYSGFSYGELSWQLDESRPVGINPSGTKQGLDIGGVLPDDQRRSGSFPDNYAAKTNYVYEGLQGVQAQAILLARHGYPDVWQWSAQAIRRAYYWATFVHGQPPNDAVNGSDDRWQSWVVNRIYPGLNLPQIQPAPHGKAVGYTDWTTLTPTWP